MQLFIQGDFMSKFIVTVNYPNDLSQLTKTIADYQTDRLMNECSDPIIEALIKFLDEKENEKS